MFNIDYFKKNSGKEKVAIIGLGYVGLPLAVLFDTLYNVIGFDINQERIKQLQNNLDKTNEIDSETLRKCNIYFTSNAKEISFAKVIIISVPTPIDKHNIPDLKPILKASEIVGENLTENSVVVFESTVYPGLTEEECVPILEKTSGLKWKKDFFVGYSPERINPGDKEHTIDKIKKVVSGDTDETLDFLSNLYGNVITAGVHQAPTIKTAEAAKVIENTQRDLNIALMNELSIIFNKMDIDTSAVLDAAASKWNFLRFEPGLVGGHCIGVDPYYLTFKAKSIGYHPETILAGRKINDYMGKFVAENSVKLLIKAGKAVKDSKILILGLTFKENINDIRNTKVVDIYNELKEYGTEVFIYDPMLDKQTVNRQLYINILENESEFKPYDAIIFAVKHKLLLDKFTLEKIKELLTNNSVLVDIKGVFDKKYVENENILYWRL